MQASTAPEPFPTLRRAIDWLEDIADAHDEGDAIGRALSRWLEAMTAYPEAPEIDTQLATYLDERKIDT
jgi:hypothetical protein